MRCRWFLPLLCTLLFVYVGQAAAERPTELVPSAPEINPTAVIWRTPSPPAEPQAGDVWVNRQDGAEMVYVPAGEFLMGSKEGEGASEEHPQHKVYLDGYWIYKTEVTVAQYRKFCQATGRQMPREPDTHPVVNVNWDDATAYAQWAGAALPTEAQWEKAARGTDGRQYPWGNDWDAKKCYNSVGGNAPWEPKPVGSYPDGASPYGTLDMAGNALEWCADWYDSKYYQSSPLRNPTGPATGTARLQRGGSWYFDTPDFFRAAYRVTGLPTASFESWGFRCAFGSPGQ